MTLSEIIMAAKIGRYRKDAQIDTCDVFAAALYDALKARDIPCSVYTVAFTRAFSRMPEWYHGVVKVAGKYYDSLGEFSCDIIRTRNRIHPKVTFDLSFTKDIRDGFFNDEYADLHEHYLKFLAKAMNAAPSIEIGNCAPRSETSSISSGDLDPSPQQPGM